ncbi:hypothetical protein ACPWSR_13065 [Alloiococcus sp. CFN-8]|uniref:hypothetical protein n=1 Tax=Alloiococcus sp. CFN-8 TaxID=3416081 RepID=UPI003CEF7047
MEWINAFGIIIVVLILIPNIIYAFKFKGVENKCKNKIMNFFEQLGRYGSMFFMAFNIGILEYGFKLKVAFLLWIFIMIVLIIAYWIGWLLYFKRPSPFCALTLAIIPSAIFVLSGILSRDYLLLIFGLIFCIGHVYVSYVNYKG